MWLECHHRSTRKHQDAECNYTLFFRGSATFKERNSPPRPILSPRRAAPHGELRAFTRVTCSAPWAGSKAEVTRTSSFTPPGWGASPGRLQKGQAILQQLKSSDLGEEVAKNTIPALLKQVTHLFLFIKPLAARERLPPTPTPPLKIKKLHLKRNVSVFQSLISTQSKSLASKTLKQNASSGVKLKCFNLPKTSSPKRDCFRSSQNIFWTCQQI